MANSSACILSGWVVRLFFEAFRLAWGGLAVTLLAAGPSQVTEPREETMPVLSNLMTRRSKDETIEQSLPYRPEADLRHPEVVFVLEAKSHKDSQHTVGRLESYPSLRECDDAAGTSKTVAFEGMDGTTYQMFVDRVARITSETFVYGWTRVRGVRVGMDVIYDSYGAPRRLAYNHNTAW